MEKVLIVVDMQNDFITGVLGSKEAVRARDNLAEYLNNIDSDTSVIFTQDTHYNDYLETQEGKNLPVPHCIRGTDGWKIAEVLTKPFNDTPVTVEKGSFGSFALSSTICDIVEDINNAEFILCGVCTDICVVSNALLLKAAFPEIKISVMKDMCAGVTPESHEAAITTMKSCQINII